MDKEKLRKEAEEYRIHFENELYLFDNTDIFPNDIEEAYFNGIESREEQLTKAKEIIKKLRILYFSPVVTKDDVKRQDEILAETEKFLSEVEK